MNEPSRRESFAVSSSGINTPAESTTTHAMDEQVPGPRTRPAVPWPRSTYVIMCATSGRALVHRSGEVMMDHPRGDDSFLWQCEEDAGWLGFKDPGSGKYLGSNAKNILHCQEPHLRGWEFFAVQPIPHPQGAYLLKQPSKEDRWNLVTIGAMPGQSYKRLRTLDASSTSSEGPVKVSFYEISTVELPEYMSRIRKDIYASSNAAELLSALVRLQHSS